MQQNSHSRPHSTGYKTDSWRPLQKKILSAPPYFAKTWAKICQNLPCTLFLHIFLHIFSRSAPPPVSLCQTYQVCTDVLTNVKHSKNVALNCDQKDQDFDKVQNSNCRDEDIVWWVLSIFNISCSEKEIKTNHWLRWKRTAKQQPHSWWLRDLDFHIP